MMLLLYILTAGTIGLAALAILAGVVRLLTLDMGRWWAREGRQPQQYGEGRGIPHATR